jgi:phage shock protein C
MAARHTKFYLDKREGKVMGVCAGIADYTGVDPLLVRIGAILLTLFAMGPILPLIYLVVAWLASDRPRELDYADAEDRKFWQGVRAKPANSVRDVRSSFRDIDRRLSDLEIHYTSNNRRLADEIDSLR